MHLLYYNYVILITTDFDNISKKETLSCLK